MKLPNWFKVLWWAMLLLISSVTLYKRYDAITTGGAALADVFIFLIWVALMLLPILKEVSFFGISLRKEIEELKSSLQLQMLNLKSDIQNSIDVRTQFNPNIYFTPPPDSHLPAMEERFRQILEETLRAQGMTKPVTVTEEPAISPDAQFLFSVRFAIEKEMRRIWQARFGEESGRRHVPIFQMARAFVEAELLDPRLENIVREVYAICSPAIHGEFVSENQVRFVRDIAPGLLTSLRAIT